MKPTLLIISLLLGSFSFSAIAQNGSEAGASKTIQLEEAFTAVSIEDDLTVVLTDGASDKIIVEGNDKSVVARVEDGQLYLSARGRHGASDVKVYVPAGYLSKVYMNSNGLLSSSDVLSNQKIKILLAAEGRINVRSKGDVSIESASNIQFIKGR